MTLAIQTIVKKQNGSWVYTWNSNGSPNYRIVFNGVQQTVVQTPTFTWDKPATSKLPPAIEVEGTGQTALSEQYIPYLVLQWYTVPGTANYLVQEYVSGNWQTVSQIRETGLWVYTFQSATLTDKTTYNFRVAAVDSHGNQSTPRLYNRYVVCPPASPEAGVVVSYTNPNVQVAAGS